MRSEKLNHPAVRLLLAILMLVAAGAAGVLTGPQGGLLQPVIGLQYAQSSSIRYAGILSAALLLFMAAAVFMVECRNMKKEAIGALLCLGIGCGFLFSMSPFAPPDEVTHYNSTLLVSNTLLLQENNTVEAEYQNFEGLKAHYNVPDSYEKISKELGKQMDENPEKTEISSFYCAEYPLAYAPQALGVTLARLLGLNFITLFIVGRFFNLLFYTLCVYVAIRQMPRFKTLMLLIAIMPMALHQAASFSYDSMINGLAFVLTALLLRGILTTEKMTMKRFVILWIVSVILAPIKLVYIFVLLLFLLIPKENFSSSKQKYLWFLLLFGASVLAILLLRMTGLRNNISAGSGLNWEGEQNYSLGFVLAHPLKTAKVFLNTVRYEGLWLVKCCIGLSFAGLNLSVPEKLVYVYLALILTAGLCDSEKAEHKLKKSSRGMFVAIIMLVSLALMLTMFLNWTGNTSNIIQGLQGRYFIPVFIFFPMILSTDFQLPNILDRTLISAAVCLNSLVLLTIIYKTIYV